MYKTKLILILSILSTVFLVSAEPVYAVGGRNGECLDADVTGYSNVSDNFKYSANESEVVEGVCVKAGNDMFGDGHSSKLTEDGTYEGCYKISGLGTETLSIKRISDGSKCKEISHLDFYFSKAESQEEVDEPEEPKDEEVQDDPAVPEDPMDNPVEEDSIEDHPAGGIGGDETEEEDKDNYEEEEDDDVFERDEEEYESEVKALSEIKELPKTGFRSWLGSIGIILTTVGYYLKKAEKRKRIV